MNLLALPTGWRDEAHRLRDRYARPDLAALCEALETYEMDYFGPFVVSPPA